jgi:hypothetical protein
VAQLWSLGHMTRAQKIWDFVFGVALIGGAPLIVILLLAVGLHYLFTLFTHGHEGWQAIFALFSAILTLWFACRWRFRHRLLPRSIFPLEVVVGLLFGGVFMMLLLLTNYAAYHAD